MVKKWSELKKAFKDQYGWWWNSRLSYFLYDSIEWNVESKNIVRIVDRTIERFMESLNEALELLNVDLSKGLDERDRAIFNKSFYLVLCSIVVLTRLYREHKKVSEKDVEPVLERTWVDVIEFLRKENGYKEAFGKFESVDDIITDEEKQNRLGQLQDMAKGRIRRGKDLERGMGAFYALAETVADDFDFAG